MYIYISILYFILINLSAFLVFGIDKKRAVKHKWRIPERTLLLLAAVGGSIGALVGMKVYHHKTKHPKFYIGIPVLLVIQIMLVIYTVYILNSL